MRFKFLEKKIPPSLKKILSPDRNFADSTKKEFIAYFDAKYKPVTGSVFTFVAKIAVVGMVLIIGLTSGASVYAETKNVSPTNILYPLKRLNESIQLALVSSTDKPKLQAKFAAVRAQEIDALAANASSSPEIIRLANDLDKEMVASIIDARIDKLSDGKLQNFCDQLLSTIATPSSAVHQELMNHPYVLKSFEDQCSNYEDNNPDVSVTSSPIVTKPILRPYLYLHPAKVDTKTN